MAVLVGSGEMHGGCFFIVPKPSLGAAAARASQSISSLPHNHIHPVLRTRFVYKVLVSLCCRCRLQVKPGAIAISLVKGMRVRADGPQLISHMVNR